MSTATIELKDEVNCKIYGLDTATRRKLQNKFSYMLPHAYHTPAFKLGRWDGKVSFFTFGALTYISLLEDILPILLEEGYEIDIKDDRIKYEFDLPEINVDHFAHKSWPEGHPTEGQPVVLRDYQQQVINRFMTNPTAVQEIATGAGKTLLTAALSNLVETALSNEQQVMHKLETGYNAGRSIVIVPNKGLVTQTEEDYLNLGLDVGVYFGDRKDLGKTHTICTWQSLEVMSKRFKNGDSDLSLEEFADGVICLIADECFDGDTPVLTPDGYRPIREIKAGDKVINYNETTAQFKEDTVVKQHVNLPKSSSEDMLELDFDDGSVLQVTANHEFLTDQGWIRADQLTAEMEIINMGYTK